MKRTRVGPHRHARRSRRAAIMVAALICLVLISLILGTLLRLTLLHRKQVRGEQRRLQAVWLVESGIDRAARRLAADVTYPGEAWKIAAEQLDGHHRANVSIQVQDSEDNPALRWVEVQAVFPAESDEYVRRTKRVTVRVKTES